MFAVTVEKRFWASHQLIKSDGSVEASHAHNWQVSVDVASAELDARGMVADFAVLEDAMDRATADFDNVCLDGLDCFRSTNASAEKVAECIYDRLMGYLPRDLALLRVRVAEAPGCWASFLPDIGRGRDVLPKIL